MQNLKYKIYSNNEIVKTNLPYHKMISVVDFLIYSHSSSYFIVIGHNELENYDVPIFTYTGKNAAEWEDLKNEKVKVLTRWNNVKNKR